MGFAGFFVLFMLVASSVEASHIVTAARAAQSACSGCNYNQLMAATIAATQTARAVSPTYTNANQAINNVAVSAGQKAAQAVSQGASRVEAAQVGFQSVAPEIVVVQSNPCNNFNCPVQRCDLGNSKLLQKGGYCKVVSGSPQCFYPDTLSCDFGCESKSVDNIATGVCRQNLCIGKDLADTCSGSERKYSKSCDISTGAVTEKSESCAYGCSAGICKAGHVSNLAASPSEIRIGDEIALSWLDPQGFLSSWRRAYWLHKGASIIKGPVDISGSKSYVTLDSLKFEPGQHAFSIQVCNSAGCSQTKEASFNVLLPLPKPVTSIGITPNSVKKGQPLSLSWLDPQGFSGDWRREYEVIKLGENVKVTGSNSASASPITIATYSLAAGDYLFKIKICNSAGCSQAREASFKVEQNSPPEAPSINSPNIAATASGLSNVDISWSTSTDPDNDRIARYLVKFFNANTNALISQQEITSNAIRFSNVQTGNYRVEVLASDGTQWSRVAQKSFSVGAGNRYKQFKSKGLDDIFNG